MAVITLSQIAEWIGGKLVGEDVPITGAAVLRDAAPGDITFCDSPRHLAALATSRASAVIATSNLAVEQLPTLYVADVHAAFARVASHFRPPRVPRPVGISPGAWVASSAVLGAGVNIYPGAYVGEDVILGDGVTLHSGVRALDGCAIGDDSVLFPNVVLYENTRLGRRVTVHAGAVLGAYGFGYRLIEGRHQLGAQLGCVEVHDDVEIGAGATIDRGTYGPTVVGSGTKIDDQVMIGHNCRIGEHNLLCSQVGIAGSCTTGDYVVMAGQVGIRDHMHIGDRAVLGAKAGVMADIPAGAAYLGIPATPEREQMVIQAALAKLPELRKEFRALQRLVEQLERRIREAGGSEERAA